MKSLLIASLVLAPLTATPALAASIEDHPSAGQHRIGAFAGARLRLAVGGEQAGQPRLGLAVSGVDHRRAADGSLRTRFADGAEFGLSGERRLGLTLGGEPVQRTRERLNASEGSSTPNLIIYGVVAIVAAGAAAGVISALDD